MLYGGYARGRMWRGPEARAHAEAMVSAIRAGWTDANPAFRRLFSMLFLPHGTPEQMAWYDELQRRSTSAETAVRLYEARNRIDVLDVARAGDDADAGRSTRAGTASSRSRRAGCSPPASRAPGSSCWSRRTTSCSSDEPAWREFRGRARAFLGLGAGGRRTTAVTTLSPRELEVLELVAAG